MGLTGWRNTPSQNSDASAKLPKQAREGLQWTIMRFTSAPSRPRSRPVRTKATSFSNRKRKKQTRLKTKILYGRQKRKEKLLSPKEEILNYLPVLLFHKRLRKRLLEVDSLTWS